jgi:1-aminocyclopropane-1-carboxylate deaminase
LSLPAWSAQTPLQLVAFDWAKAAGIELAVLRLDLLDALISGNKWFKLGEHLRAAREQGAPGLISLGGAHSNHLHALAAAGLRDNFATVGLLRGHAQVTPTVSDLHAMGMQLHWLGYAGYRERHAADFWTPWLARYPGFYPIPEGGGGLPGALGCAQMLALLRAQLPALGWDDYQGICLACGTGTTLAGLLLAEAGAHPLYGVTAVPIGHGVASNIEQILLAAGQPVPAYQLWDGSRAGFAKVDAHLLEFMQQCEAQSGVPLEPLYTAKALLHLRERVQAGYFAPGTRLVFIHTGGLQGRRGMAL